MIRFEKVPFEEYYSKRKDYVSKEEAMYEWNNIKLPKRATNGSAGYDFYAPYDIHISHQNTDGTFNYVLVPTGIRFVTDQNNTVLMCYPRSGLGFKYSFRLANTTGVIDSDYQYSDNYGHIMVKATSENNVDVNVGSGLFQGIITTYLKTDDDESEYTRNGGFGSTDNRR